MHVPLNASMADITGVLLAGGLSRRMGFDKACIKVGGQPLFSRSLELLRSHFQTVLIAGNRPDLAAADLPVIADIYPGSALGGLHTGLRAAQTGWIFVAPCDMPYPDARILELLASRRNGCDAVVPRTPAGYEPVFALYHKRCLPRIEEMLQQGQYRIYDFYQRINVHFLDWHQLPDDWERSLLNLNTPDQLARLREEQT
jgi:molybdopterin-guanine dinucleotide biosynthesis protein A